MPLDIDPTDPGVPPTQKGALSSNPQTFNFLSPLNFTFILKRAPNTNYNIHLINIPSLTLPQAIEPTSILALPKPGDHMEFSPLIVQFKVDENFNNYLEIWKWLMALGRIPNPVAFKSLENKPYWTGQSETSEIMLTILDSSRNVNIVLNYHDCFPVTLSELIFDVQLRDVDFITATCQFAYSYFEIEQINSAAQPSPFPAELAKWPDIPQEPPYVPASGVSLRVD